MPEIEVFSEVIATLSESFLSLIPGDKDEFLGTHLSNLGVLAYQEQDKNLICLSGKIDAINKCKEILENSPLVKPDESADVSNHSDEDKSQIYNDLDEMLNSSTLVRTVPSLDDVKQYLRSIGNDNLVDANETARKDTKVIVSKSGRTIKPSVKLENYDELPVDQYDDLEDSLEDGEEQYSRRERRKRKTSKPKKVNKSKALKNTEPDVADSRTENEVNVSNSVENIQKTVYLNKKSPSRHQFSLTYEKEMSSKSGIKKYYEDRLPFKFFCDKCSFKTKRESHYQKHLELHNLNPDLKLHKCSKCDFTTIRLSMLQRHSVSHLSSDSNVLKCSECSYSTNNKAFLKSHKKRHMARETYACKYCKFTTRYKQRLLKHQQSHSEVPSEEKDIEIPSASVYQCKSCPYETANKLSYRRHLKAVHLNQRPHLCDTCGMAFKRTDALQIHKEVHKDKSLRKLPFSCKVCQKKFKSMAHVKEHMAVHTNVRSFQCHICGQMFKTRQVQQRHLQGVHLKTTWHECSRCKRTFSSKYTLKRHLRQHDEDSNLHGRIHPVTGVVEVGAVGQNQDVIQGQGTDQMDENATAIQTIMISSEDLAEFTPQLQTVSLQAAPDIGEVYIHGLENVTDNVTMQSDDMGQILIPSSEPNYTEHVPQLVPPDTDPQSTGIVQDLVNDNVKEMYQSLTTEQGLQLIQDKQSSEISDTVTEYSIPTETFKLTLDQLNPGTESAASNQLINQVNPDLEVLNYETVHYVADQGQLIEGENEGQFVQIVAPDGQTYRIKVDSSESILNLDTVIQGCKVLEVSTQPAPS